MRNRILISDALTKFRKHKAAIKIQAWVRSAQHCAKYKAMLAFRAREKLAKLLRKACLKRLKTMGREYRIELAQRVRLLQRLMKGYLASKRVKERLKDERRYNAAVIIQKYCRGYTGF